MLFIHPHTTTEPLCVQVYPEIEPSSINLYLDLQAVSEDQVDLRLLPSGWDRTRFRLDKEIPAAYWFHSY